MKDTYGQHEIVILDIEASGLDLDVSYPIEAAWLSLTEDSDSFLINPDTASNWVYWNQYAEDHIHNIARDECVSSGLSVGQACERLNSQLRGCLAISDGYAQDKAWIEMLFSQAGAQIRFDIISMHEFVTATGKHPDLITQFYAKKKQRNIAHRALPDCEMNLQIIKEIGII